MIINKLLKFIINNNNSDNSNNDNNSDNSNSNNNNNITTTTTIFSNYIIKYILRIICNHINSVFKSIESSEINIKNERQVNQYIISLALVSKLFFQELSNNIKSVVNFNYDYLFNKISIQLINKKKLHTVNPITITKNFKPSYPANYIPASSKYSIIRLENIETIKLDLYSNIYFFDKNSIFYNNYTFKDGSKFKLKFTSSFIFEKIKELVNLKRIVIRISAIDRLNIQNIQIPNLICNNIQVSDFIHSDNENQDIKLIKKTGSIIVSSKDKLLYETIKHFNGDSFKRLYIYSTTNFQLVESLIGCTGGINDGINYFQHLTLIHINKPMSIKSIIMLLDSTPNLQELGLLVCFNVLILALSNNKNLQELGLDKVFHCESCSINQQERDTYVNDIQTNYKHLLELFKNKSKLNTLKLSHKCRFTNSYGMAGADVINNIQDDSKLFSFHQQLSTLILSIPNLTNLQLYGITNPLLFKHLIQVENNKSITHYRLNLGIALPSISYIQLFQSLVNNNQHIQLFKYYEKGSQRDFIYTFKYNKNKNKI